MKPTDFETVERLCNWFARPLLLAAQWPVKESLDALNDHPLAHDMSSQDYVMPRERYLECPGRFRVWGENQDNFYCFVRDENASDADPPVYFETCLDLVRDCGVDPERVLDGNCVLVTEHFFSFLAFMLVHHICLRLEKGSHLADEVNGIVFSEPIQVPVNLSNPLGCEFFAGYTPYVGRDVICIPTWGAAFRHPAAREEFETATGAKVGQAWD